MSYPKPFAYFLSRLNNFSRQQVRLQTYANTTFTPNQQLVIELPQGLIDLSTFTLKGKVATSGAGVYLPPVEMLFDSISIEVGGVSVQNGFTNYGDLFNIFRQYQMEDKKNFRKILQLEGRQGKAPDAAPDAAGTQDSLLPLPFAMYNFLGFLGSVKVLDTTLLPPVKIYFRLAPTSVLTKAAASATVPSFTLSDVRGTVDILDIADGVYYNMISQRLSQAPLEIPFENYQTIIGTLSSRTQTTRWSTSSDCLEAIIATFKTLTPNSFTHDTTTRLSAYFTRGTDGIGEITTSQFKVNGIPYPSMPCQTEFGDVFVDTAHTLGASQDVLGATDVGMDSHAVWNQKYFTHAHSFTYPDAEDSHRMVGLSGRANQILGDWETSGTGTNLQPLLWLKSKSILRIGSGKMVEIVL
jgi:hypothetical protein